MVLALLEMASEKMELELLLNSPDALRIVGKLEPKLIVPLANVITTKLSSRSLHMRIVAQCVLDCLEPSALPSGAATLMDKIRIEQKKQVAEQKKQVTYSQGNKSSLMANPNPNQVYGMVARSDD